MVCPRVMITVDGGKVSLSRRPVITSTVVFTSVSVRSIVLVRACFAKRVRMLHSFEESTVVRAGLDRSALC